MARTLRHVPRIIQRYKTLQQLSYFLCEAGFDAIRFSLLDDIRLRELVEGFVCFMKLLSCLIQFSGGNELFQAAHGVLRRFIALYVPYPSPL